MIQWGDPTGTWMWGESLYGEKFDDEFTPELSNIRGSISMANSGPNSNGSQFFINQVPNLYLDNKHSVFGQVINWMDNVDKIAKSKVWRNDKPVKDIKIIKAEVMQFDGAKLLNHKIDIDSELEKIEASLSAKFEADKVRPVANGDKVWVHYILTLEDWSVKDSSYDRGEPIEFTVWKKQMIAWFDAGVIWMKMWDKKTITLEPKDAYWEYDESKIRKTSLEDLKAFEDAWFKIEAGSVLPTTMGMLKIADVKDGFAFIDTNHELAWKSLTFEMEMVYFKN